MAAAAGARRRAAGAAALRAVAAPGIDLFARQITRSLRPAAGGGMLNPRLRGDIALDWYQRSTAAQMAAAAPAHNFVVDPQLANPAEGFVPAVALRSLVWSGRFESNANTTALHGRLSNARRGHRGWLPGNLWQRRLGADNDDVGDRIEAGLNSFAGGVHAYLTGLERQSQELDLWPTNPNGTWATPHYDVTLTTPLMGGQPLLQANGTLSQLTARFNTHIDQLIQAWENDEEYEAALDDHVGPVLRAGDGAPIGGKMARIIAAIKNPGSVEMRVTMTFNARVIFAPGRGGHAAAPRRGRRRGRGLGGGGALNKKAFQLAIDNFNKHKLRQRTCVIPINDWDDKIAEDSVFAKYQQPALFRELCVYVALALHIAYRRKEEDPVLHSRAWVKLASGQVLTRWRHRLRAASLLCLATEGPRPVPMGDLAQLEDKLDVRIIIHHQQSMAVLYAGRRDRSSHPTDCHDALG